MDAATPFRGPFLGPTEGPSQHTEEFLSQPQDIKGPQILLQTLSHLNQTHLSVLYCLHIYLPSGSSRHCSEIRYLASLYLTIFENITNFLFLLKLGPLQRLLSESCLIMSTKLATSFRCPILICRVQDITMRWQWSHSSCYQGYNLRDVL